MKQLLFKDYFCFGEFPVMAEPMPYKGISNDERHTHEFSELTFFFEGECIHHCNGEDILIRAGDMLLLHPGTSHYFEGEFKAVAMIYDADIPYPPITSSSELRTVSDILYPSRKEKERNQAVPFRKFSLYDSVILEDALLRLHYEVRHRRIGHHLMIMALFTEIVTYLARGENLSFKRKETSKLQNAIMYMNTHFSEKIDFDYLSKISGVSRRTFFNHFRSTFSMSPHEYLTQLRLIQAQSMLEQGASTAETALACGFYDKTHMSRIFKSVKGNLPGYYQLKNPDTV